jgi:hypothetical protein
LKLQCYISIRQGSFLPLSITPIMTLNSLTVSLFPLCVDLGIHIPTLHIFPKLLTLNLTHDLKWSPRLYHSWNHSQLLQLCLWNTEFS